MKKNELVKLILSSTIDYLLVKLLFLIRKTLGKRVLNTNLACSNKKYV